MAKTMRLDTRPGDKVCYMNPGSGHDLEAKTADALLDLGQTYTIEKLVGSEVFLEEVPGVAFNAVFFENRKH